jgi:hypothetical protein
MSLSSGETIAPRVSKRAAKQGAGGCERLLALAEGRRGLVVTLLQPAPVMQEAVSRIAAALSWE